jgi:hypothetical protein
LLARRRLPGEAARDVFQKAHQILTTILLRLGRPAARSLAACSPRTSRS